MSPARIPTTRDPVDPDPDATADPHAARLFGLVVMDREGASSGDDGSVRFVAVAEGEAYELVRTVAPLAIHHHEALALVTEGWAAPLPPAGDEDANPPLREAEPSSGPPSRTRHHRRARDGRDRHGAAVARAGTRVRSTRVPSPARWPRRSGRRAA